MYETVYMFGAGCFLAVFIIVLLHPRYRHVALWTALACTPAGIIGELWLIPDYWNPQYLFPLLGHPWRFGFEDLIFTGAFAGTCAAAFEYVAEKRGFARTPSISARTFLVMEGYGLLGCIVMVFAVSALNLTAIHSLFLSMSVILLFMIRSCVSLALIVVPLAGAIAVSYMVFMSTVFNSSFPGVIEMIWNLPNTWGVSFFGVPVEEPIWAFLTAIYCGVVYRVAANHPFPFGRRFWKRLYRNAWRPDKGQ